MEGPKINLIQMPNEEVQRRIREKNTNLLNDLLSQAIKPSITLSDVLKKEDHKEINRVTSVQKVDPPVNQTPIAIPKTVEVKQQEYKSDSEMFDTKQNMLVTLASIKYNNEVDLSDLSEGQKRAIDAVLLGKNILLTGPAGTGKSHTIQRIKEIFQKMKRSVSITATTGISAVSINGNTIHSWSGIGICGSKETALNRVMTYKGPQDRIKSTNLLIIDEVSMLSDLHLDILDHVCKHVRQNNLPFGGLQVILSGDFYQLSPVKAPRYAFESENFDKLIHEVIELTFIFRQFNREFCEALNEIRIGDVSQKTKDLFATCIGKEFEGDIKPTELYPLKIDVENFNESELWKLASEQNPVREIGALDEIIEKPPSKKTIPDKIIKEWQTNFNKNCMAQKILSLAIHAQVMLIKNIDVEAGLCNGSRGVIVGFGGHGEPIVKFRNGQVLYMQTQIWHMRVNETTKIRRTQYPLLLAFSTSIHKSQGLSLDCVRMDLGGRVFSVGMTYTALSRVRSLEGLSIIEIDWEQVQTDKRVKEFYAKHKK